jgi:hypothetical protein
LGSVSFFVLVVGVGLGRVPVLGGLEEGERLPVGLGVGMVAGRALELVS